MDKTFYEISNKEIYDKIQNIDKKLDIILIDNTKTSMKSAKALFIAVTSMTLVTMVLAIVINHLRG